MRAGVIAPSVPARGSGCSREWDEDDVALLRVCGTIARAFERVPVAVLEAAVDQLRPLPRTWWPEFLELHPSPDVTVTVRVREAA